MKRHAENSTLDPQAKLAAEKAEALARLLLNTRRRHGPAAVERLEQLFSAPPAPSPVGNGKVNQQVFQFPGLSAMPWHDSSVFPAVAQLEAGAETIWRELLRALEKRIGFQRYNQERDYFICKDHWKAMYFLLGGKRIKENRSLCPETAKLIYSIPNVFGMAMFSALLPGGHIKPHRGPTNCRLTIHLGLIVPRSCGMRVGNETRRWKAGKCLVFDDTFEHEAWNESSATRFVLYVDIWHPNLTEVEVRFLKRLQQILRHENHLQTSDRILADREKERGHAWWT